MRPYKLISMIKLYFQSTGSRAGSSKASFFTRRDDLGTQSGHLECTECRPGHLNCKICGVCEELHVQSSHTKPKPNELVGEVCLCDQNH